MWRALVQAIGVWWRDVIDFAILNMLWFAFSLSVIGAAPALAAMYQLAANAVNDDYVDWRTFFGAIKQLAFPAWRWFLLQIVVYVVILVNLLYYAPVDGLLVNLLTIIWITGLVGWTALNTLYWPFFLAQEDRSIRNTYRNTVVLTVKRPFTLVGLMVMSALLTVFSVATVVPFAFVLTSLLALFSTVVVRDELETFRVASQSDS